MTNQIRVSLCSSHPDDIRAFNIAWKYILIPTETGVFDNWIKRHMISAKYPVLYAARVKTCSSQVSIIFYLWYIILNYQSIS